VAVPPPTASPGDPTRLGKWARHFGRIGVGSPLFYKNAKKKEKEKKDAGTRKGKGLLFSPCPVFFSTPV
jgi:hypothetical protein